MSPENLRANVAEERATAERALRAAEALIAAECFPDAANRAYYAVYHFTVAALLVLGHEPRTHAGAKTLLAAELVRPGRLPAEASRTFAELEQLRMAADYRRFAAVTRGQAEAALESAHELGGWVSAFLAAQGF